MTSSAILAIDQGTTNSKAVLVDLNGHIIGKSHAPVKCYYPQSGWVEQSGEEIIESVKSAIAKCLLAHPDIDIVAIGISSQRESAMAWDADTGKPLGPCISWQCRRTQSICERLKLQGHDVRIKKLTGLPIDPMFTGAKFRWLLDSIGDKGTAKRLRLGTVDSWLLWNVTGGQSFLTDISNASRTQLCDISTGKWSPELLYLFGIEEDMLPKICPTCHSFGYSREFGRLPLGIPVLSMVGDSHAALFAQGGFCAGVAKATYGTGSSVMAATGDSLVCVDGLATTVAWETQAGKTYALEGNITVSAAVLPWIAKILGIDGAVSKLAELAQRADAKGVEVLVPAMVGLGAPRWISEVHGMLDGLTFNTSPQDVARAAFESIVFQIKDVVDVIQSASEQHALSRLIALKADGGASANDWLMQLQADTLQIPVQRAEQAELSAMGAALLAGKGVGLWSTEADMERIIARFDTFDVVDASTQQYRHKNWISSIKRTVSHYTSSNKGVTG